MEKLGRVTSILEELSEGSVENKWHWFLFMVVNPFAVSKIKLHMKIHADQSTKEASFPPAAITKFQKGLGQQD